ANTNLTISGVISSPNFAAQLTKRDPGRLIFNNANTYTGFTLVQEGALNIRDSMALGSTAQGTSVSVGAALELQVEAATPQPTPDPLNGNQAPRYAFQSANITPGTPLGQRDLWDDSVTHDPHRLWVSEPLSIFGRGINNTGALRSVS